MRNTLVSTRKVPVSEIIENFLTETHKRRLTRKLTENNNLSYLIFYIAERGRSKGKFWFQCKIPHPHIKYFRSYLTYASNNDHKTVAKTILVSKLDMNIQKVTFGQRQFLKKIYLLLKTWSWTFPHSNKHFINRYKGFYTKLNTD